MQDKARGSQATLRVGNTAPQSGSVLFHRWSEFQLFAVIGGRYQQIQRESLSVSPFYKVTVIGDFQRFYGSRCGSHFSPPGVKSGGSFSSALTAAAILAGLSGDMCKDLHQQQVDVSEVKNAEQQAAAQHKVKTSIVRPSASPSVAAQSSAQKSQPVDL